MDTMTGQRSLVFVYYADSEISEEGQRQVNSLPSDQHVYEARSGEPQSIRRISQVTQEKH